MSPEEANKVMRELSQRHNQALEGLVPLARAAVNVLKDHNQHSTARDLEAQLFAIEAASQEFTNAIMKDPPVFLEAVFRSMR